jgi:hypothetical protein
VAAPWPLLSPPQIAVAAIHEMFETRKLDKKAEQNKAKGRAEQKGGVKGTRPWAWEEVEKAAQAAVHRHLVEIFKNVSC